MSENENVEQKQPKQALLFELENFAVPSRKALFDILKSMLTDLNVELTVPLFSRYCLLQPLSEFLPDLPAALGADKVNGKKFAEDVINAMDYFYRSDELAVTAGLMPLVDYALQHNIACTAVSALDANTVDKVMTTCGFKERGVRLFEFEARDKSYPGADVWMRACKEVDVEPRACLTLVSSMESCKSSLTAGMRSLVVPDEYTAFQDFGGANRVLDDLAEADPAEILEPLTALQ